MTARPVRKKIREQCGPITTIILASKLAGKDRNPTIKRFLFFDIFASTISAKKILMLCFACVAAFRFDQNWTLSAPSSS